MMSGSLRERLQPPHTSWSLSITNVHQSISYVYSCLEVPIITCKTLKIVWGGSSMQKELGCS